MFGAEFEPTDVDVPDGSAGRLRILGVGGGSGQGGPPVRLLHGFPQSHVMWHRIAPEPARDRTVVAADLRGCAIAGAGHFLAEANHDDTLAALRAFLGGSPARTGILP